MVYHRAQNPLTVSGTDTKLPCQAVIEGAQPAGSYMREWKLPKSFSDSALVNMGVVEYYFTYVKMC